MWRGGADAAIAGKGANSIALQRAVLTKLLARDKRTTPYAVLRWSSSGCAACNRGSAHLKDECPPLQSPPEFEQHSKGQQKMQVEEVVIWRSCGERESPMSAWGARSSPLTLQQGCSIRQKGRQQDRAVNCGPWESAAARHACRATRCAVLEFHATAYFAALGMIPAHSTVLKYDVAEQA